MSTSHPGYFGKVGMRYFHKTLNKFYCPTLNLDSLWVRWNRIGEVLMKEIVDIGFRPNSGVLLKLEARETPDYRRDQGWLLQSFGQRSFA